MRAGEERDFSFKRALGLSTLLHLCVLPLAIAILMGGPYVEPAFQLDQTSEGSVAILTIEHRVSHASAARRAPSKSQRSTAVVRTVTRKPAAPRPAVASQHSPAPTVGRANRPTRLAALLHASATAEPEATQHPSATRAAVATAPATSGAATAAASPSPSPSPAATAAAVARFVDPPPGGWGQNFRDPTVFDDDALSALRARFHTAALAHVAVDENGRATNVTVEGGSLDPEGRADLAARLRTLRYIPAECNGLRCAASFDLKL
ncbi:MAG: hypothetical protein ABI346_04175 [Candidatus Baltobacteraceae bacterium]